MFLWYCARATGLTQEERENMVNELLLLKQRVLRIFTHTVDDNRRTININKNAGSDQMGHGEEDNANNGTLHDLQSLVKEDVQSLEGTDNITNDALLNRTKSKED